MLTKRFTTAFNQLEQKDLYECWKKKKTEGEDIQNY
jgi:uncharacterized protein (DUF433 family)